jgi:hypothetical protein
MHVNFIKKLHKQLVCFRRQSCICGSATYQQGRCELVKAFLHVDDCTIKALLSDIHEVCQSDALHNTQT